MKTINRILILSIAFMALTQFESSTVLAQEAKKTQEPKVAQESKDEQAIKKKLAAIQTQVEKNDYAKIAEHMTPEAQNKLAVRVVTDAYGYMEMSKQLKKQLGAMADQLGMGSTEKLEEILKKNKLDDLEIESRFQMMIQGSGTRNEPPASGEGKEKEKKKSKTDSRKAENKKSDSKDIEKDVAVSIDQQILDALDKDKKRWEIVSAIARASKSPLPTGNIISGDVTDIKIEKDSATVTVDKPAAKPQQGGVQMMIQGGTSQAIVKMIKKDGKWFHNGLDEEAMMKLMLEAMGDMPQGMPPGFPGAGSKSDF